MDPQPPNHTSGISTDKQNVHRRYAILYLFFPTIRLAPSYSCLIAFFISAHTSAEHDRVFTTEDYMNPEALEYAYPFNPFFLGNATNTDPVISLNWRTKHRKADEVQIPITRPPHW